jgi:hypothetical protein
MDIAVEETVMQGNYVCLPGLLVEFQTFTIKGSRVSFENGVQTIVSRVTCGGG